MIIKKLALYFLIFLLILMLSVIAIVSSETGAKFVINQANRINGVELNYTKGAVFDKLTLGKSTLNLDGVNVSFDRLLVDVEMRPLLLSRLTVNQISVSGLKVALAEVNNAPASQPTGETITAPIPILINNINVADFELDAAWGKISWAQLQSKLSFDQSLSVTNTRIHTLKWRSPVSSPANAKPTLFNPQTLTLPGIPEQAVDIPVDIKKLTIRIQDLIVDDQRVLSQLNSTLSLQDDRLVLSELAVIAADFTAQAGGHVTLSPVIDSELRLQFDSKQEAPNIAAASAQIRGRLAQLETQFTVSFPKDGQASGTLTTNLSVADYPAQLNLNWQDVPLPVEPSTSITGNATLRGTHRDFTAALHGDISDGTSVNGEISGSLSNMQVSQLHIAKNNNWVETRGTLNWKQTLHWQGETEFVVKDAKQWLTIPTTPSAQGKLNHHLRLNASDWRAGLSFDDVNGVWMQQNFSLSGQADLNHLGHIQVERLVIDQGENQVHIDGEIDNKQSDLSVNIDLANLANILPTLSGEIRVTGRLTGDLAAPRVDAQLSGSDLNWQQVSVEKVNGQITLDNQQQLNSQLVAQSVTTAQHRIDKATVRVSGSLPEHQLTLRTQGGDADLHFALDGTWQEEQWQGRWQQGSLRSHYANLDLLQPFSLFYRPSDGEAVIMPHCWQAPNEETQLCLDQMDLADNQLDFAVTLRAVVVGPLLRRLALPVTDTDARLSASAKGQWPLDTLPSATLNVTATPSSWQFQQGAEASTVSVEKLYLNAALSPEKAQFDGRLQSPQLGQLGAAVTITEPTDRASVDGTLTIAKLDLSAFANAHPNIELLSGIVQGETRLSGTLDNPALYGELTIKDGEFSPAGVPLRLSGWQQTVLLQGQKGQLDGTFALGNGQGTLQGEVQWLPELALNVNLQGDNLDVAYQKDMRATISPDLALTLSSEAVSLTGKLAVPKAYIKIRELPQSAQTPSNDVIIVDAPDNTAPLARDINIDLSLLVDSEENNSVYLDAFGLTTNMQGNLSINQRKQRIQADGIVRLVNGRYRAFGQNLIIRTGELQFNGPVSQPVVSVEAIRDPDLTEDDVIAGVRLAGNVSQPQISFFSEPAMDDAASLSYLLRGSAVQSSGTGQSQDSMLAGLLMAAGLSRSENLVGKVGDSFGIENLALDASGQGDDTTLSLTGYIAPGVQLRYGVGVFSSAAEVALRYEITPKLYIEAMSSSVRNALDLYWRFSIDKDSKSVAKER